MGLLGAGMPGIRLGWTIGQSKTLARGAREASDRLGFCRGALFAVQVGAGGGIKLVD